MGEARRVDLTEGVGASCRPSNPHRAESQTFPHVRYGSLADILARQCDVRFTPKSRLLGDTSDSGKEN